MFRTRFAPSPTGYLHVGGLRTALYSYLLAKQNNGQFLLRIEDTDRERFVADGTSNILKSLYWANVIPDEGVTLDNVSDPDDAVIIQSGGKGPYIQSERLEIYQKYVDELIEKGFAYYCFCTQERLDEVREKCMKDKKQPGYDGHCREVDLSSAKARAAAGEKYTVRLKMPKDGETVFTDLIRGEVRIKNELVDDQVLLKSDGFPTYHLAVVVDDHLMEITHVVRGEEWISSTPKHLTLYKYFGWEPPKFAHLPLLLNSDHSKLSKRQGDVAVGDYIKKGYLPEALINFVAFLGWNPGTEQELFSLENLIKDFSLDKVGSSGSIFNLEKLDWYNREYLKKLTGEQLVNICLPWLQNESWFKADDFKNKTNDWWAQVFDLEKERVTTLAEIPEAVKFVFDSPDYDPEILAWKKSDLKSARQVLVELKPVLSEIEENAWNKAGIESAVMNFISAKQYGNGDVLWPLRVSLSGQKNSPPPFDIAAVLSKEDLLKRLDKAIG